MLQLPDNHWPMCFVCFVCFFGIHTSDIMPCMCFTCFMCFFQETWQSNVAASRQLLTHVFCVFCVFFWKSYVRYYAVHVFYVFYVFFFKRHDRAMLQLPDNNWPMCFVCFVFFFSLYFRYYAMHVFYVFYVVFFQETWQSNVAASRQSLTHVFCVFCVFFWSSYFRYYAMHVFYVFYVFFSSSVMIEHCCSFQTITEACVLCNFV